MTEPHKEIWLQPKCCAGPEGQLWCEDDVGPCECGKEWTRYVLPPASPSPGLDLEADAKAYRADMRLWEATIEKCAKVAENYPSRSLDEPEVFGAARSIADRIRALSRPVSEREDGQ